MNARLHTPGHRASATWLIVLGALLGAAAIVAASDGAVETSVREVVAVVTSHLGLDVFGAVERRVDVVVWSLRLPRVLLAAGVGAALAVSGAALQGMFRNALADPGLVGVASGSALGAMLAIYLSVEVFVLLVPIPAQLLVPAAAFVGGLGTTWLVYRLSTRAGHTSVTTMLLAGIAINAFAGAGMGLLTYLADDARLRNLVLWTLGSMAGASWDSVAVVGAVALLGVGLLMARAGDLDALLLGPSQARAMGVDVHRLERLIVASVACMVAVAIAFSGLIGFVGLVAPHIVRLSLGPRHGVLLPASALLGALVLVLADWLARTVMAPAELPIGILTALLGGPFFLALLLRHGGREMG